MKHDRARVFAICLLGFLAPLWWSYAINKFVYWLYLLAGSPSEPSQEFAWFNLYLPGCIIGLITGVLLALLSSFRLKPALLFFFAAFALGVALFTHSLDTITLLAKSPGTWVFVASTIVGAVIATRANNSFKPTPLRGAA